MIIKPVTFKKTRSLVTHSFCHSSFWILLKVATHWFFSAWRGFVAESTRNKFFKISTGLYIVVKGILESNQIDMSKLIHGFLLVGMWISQNWYIHGFLYAVAWFCQNWYTDFSRLFIIWIDLSMLLHRFVKVIPWICQNCSMYF